MKSWEIDTPADTRGDIALVHGQIKKGYLKNNEEGKVIEAKDNIEDVIVEVQDIDPQEFAELIEYVKDEFDLSEFSNDVETIEMHVEDALNAGVEMLKIVRMFKV